MYLIVLLVGLERLSALAAPTWHYQKWKPRWGWIAVAGAYVYVLSTVVAARIILGLINPGKANRDCQVHLILGKAFSMYYYGLQILCGVAAVATTLCALSVGWYRMKHIHQDAQNQARLEKTYQNYETYAILGPGRFVFGGSSKRCHIRGCLEHSPECFGYSRSYCLQLQCYCMRLSLLRCE